MKKLTQHTGIVVPLDHANVDTDAIIPKQFLQKITRSGFGQHLFNDWRFLDNDGNIKNPDFVLNKPVYENASILLTRENFGCGSSREHAPWALADYGFNVIIGTTFADIFYNNAFNNHMLLIKLQPDEIDALFILVNQHPGIEFTVNLPEQTVICGDKTYHFDVDPFKKMCLVEGLDAIGLTLQHKDAIDDFEKHIPAFLR